VIDVVKINKKGGRAVAAIAGAVIGAGIGVAATKVATDEKARKKVTDTFSSVKGQMEESFENVRGRIGGQAEEKIDDAKKTVKKVSKSKVSN
jgi:hypothetical protein